MYALGELSARKGIKQCTQILLTQQQQQHPQSCGPRGDNLPQIQSKAPATLRIGKTYEENP